MRGVSKTVCLAAFLLAAACGVMDGAAAQGAPSPRRQVVLYAGLSYIDGDSTPLMAAMLAADASGGARRFGDALILGAEERANGLRGRNALMPLSRHPLVVDADTGWKVARRLGNVSEQTGGLIASLQERTDALYALVLVGSFEEVLSQQLSYTDATSGERKRVARVTFVAGVSAFVLTLDPDSPVRTIELAATGLGTESATHDLDVELNGDQRLRVMHAAYAQAIEAAIENVGTVLQRRRDNDGSVHMVTGFTLTPGAPHQLFDFDVTKRVQRGHLETDICDIPQPCESGNCERVGAMLMHGLTAALSRSGKSVLPPLEAGYVVDAQRNLRMQLALFRSESALLTGRQTVAVQPSDAGFKYLAVWRGSQSRDNANQQLPGVLTDRSFYSSIGFFRAQTDFLDSCKPIGSLSPEPSFSRPHDGFGCSLETYATAANAPSDDAAAMHYRLAALDHLITLGDALAGQRHQQRTRSCEPL